MNIGLVKETKVKLILTDASGKMVSIMEDQLIAGKNQIEIPVKHLASGLYQVSLIFDGGYKSLKINVLK